MDETQPSLIAKLKRTEIKDRQKVLSKALERMLRDVLKISKEVEVKQDISFFEIGLTSIIAIKLASDILNDIGEDFDFRPTDIIDHPTIQSLATFLAEKIKIDEL